MRGGRSARQFFGCGARRMIWILLSAFVPVGLALIGFVPLAGFIYVWRSRERRYLRESPLVRDLLRPPGHSLREKIDELNDEINLSLLPLDPAAGTSSNT